MKCFVLTALMAAVFVKFQAKSIFHVNYYDFLELINDEAGDKLDVIMEIYLNYKDFQQIIAYIQTKNFKELVHEIEALPVMRTVLTYLEVHGIDVLYFVNEFKLMFDEIEVKGLQVGHTGGGHDFASYIKETIAVLPKEKLAALYDQKMEEDEDFKSAMEALESDEWNQLYADLWADEVFLDKVKILAENGIDVSLLIEKLIASFGQN